MHRLIAVYALGVGTAITAIYASADALPATAVILLAVLAPVVPVLVSYLLTHRKLVAQDKKVQEVHVLVNSRLSSTLDDLKSALLEVIRLKEKVGEPVASAERDAIEHVKDIPPKLEDV